MTDAIGRSWQLGTVQLDYNMPERFDLEYIGADNAEHRPVMIHRALLGSFERFIGILIEHYAGEFPLWLAPVQAIVLPIADRHVAYAREVVDASCARRGLRVRGRRPHRDGRPQDPRRGAAARCPTCWSSATRRRTSGTVAVRRHREGDLGAMPVAELAERLDRRDRAAGLRSPLYSPRMKGTDFSRQETAEAPVPISSPERLTPFDVQLVPSASADPA